MHEEAAFVADHMGALLATGVEPQDCVVLCRARHLAAAYVEELAGRRDEALRAIALSTIHAAKGLEWDHVALLGARERGLPSDHALSAEEPQRAALVAEERRLFYVALTRARKSLLVTWPQRGERRAFEPSRFLAPLVSRAAAPLAR